jgi:hypothetical protein
MERARERVGRQADAGPRHDEVIAVEEVNAAAAAAATGLVARTSRITSGARVRIASRVGCTDSRSMSAKTFTPPAICRISSRNPDPPLTYSCLSVCGSRPKTSSTRGRGRPRTRSRTASSWRRMSATVRAAPLSRPVAAPRSCTVLKSDSRPPWR